MDKKPMRPKHVPVPPGFVDVIVAGEADFKIKKVSLEAVREHLASKREAK